MDIVDSDASLHMMGLCSLDHREKKTIRLSSKIRDNQTANDIVVSDTQAKVCIKELDVYLRVYLVNDSPSVLSSGSLCNDLGYSHLRPSRETSRSSKKVRKWSNAASNTSSPCFQSPNGSSHHPLNSRQLKDSLSEKRKWRVLCWIYWNHLHEDYKDKIDLPQLR